MLQWLQYPPLTHGGSHVPSPSLLGIIILLELLAPRFGVSVISFSECTAFCVVVLFESLDVLSGFNAAYEQINTKGRFGTLPDTLLINEDCTAMVLVIRSCNTKKLRNATSLDIWRVNEKAVKILSSDKVCSQINGS